MEHRKKDTTIKQGVQAYALKALGVEPQLFGMSAQVYRQNEQSAQAMQAVNKKVEEAMQELLPTQEPKEITREELLSYIQKVEESKCESAIEI